MMHVLKVIRCIVAHGKHHDWRVGLVGCAGEQHMVIGVNFCRLCDRHWLEPIRIIKPAKEIADDKF